MYKKKLRSNFRNEMVFSVDVTLTKTQIHLHA